MVENVKLDGNLGDHEHEMIKFQILRKGREKRSRIKILDS